jgi:hypothetical protein
LAKRQQKGEETMTDKNLLMSAMAAKGYNGSALAKKLELSRVSFSYKLNSKRPFTTEEIGKIYELLELTPEQTMMIFFGK